MKGNYLVIDKSVLPEVFDKVIEAKRLIKNREVKDITEATKTAGISRSVYYKYKDYVFEFAESIQGKKISFNVMIIDKKGVLSEILNFVSANGGSVITINQGIPMNGRANISLTVDISTLDVEWKVLLEDIEKVQEVEKVEFIAME